MVMVGLAETFFPLFVLELYRDELSSGLIVSLPIMLASVLQLAAPAMVARLRSYRIAVAWCAVVQSIACPLLASIALRGAAPEWVVFAVVTLYHCGAIVCAAPWTAMMGALVPAPIRANFFARRTRTLQFGAVAGILVAACVLEFGSGAIVRAGRALGGAWPWLGDALVQRPTLGAFAIVFVLAGVMRAISAWYLYRHIEPEGITRGHRVVPPRELIGRLRRNGRWRLVGVLALFSFCTMIGSPYWTAYVREVGGLSFLHVAGLIVVWYLGKALAVAWAGSIAHRHGRRRLLIVAALLMAPVPALWAISADPVWLSIAAVVAGASIAAWELATWLAMLEALDEDERTSLLAKVGLLTWGMSTLGTVTGGWMLGLARGDAQGAAAHGAYAAIFIASSIARLACAGLISRTHRSGLPRAG
jgi:MFS family permease